MLRKLSSSGQAIDVKMNREVRREQLEKQTPFGTRVRRTERSPYVMPHRTGKTRRDAGKRKDNYAQLGCWMRLLSYIS